MTGNYLKPFAADSLWNQYPVSPKFTDSIIPTSTYYPMVGGGAFSLQVFQCAETDSSMDIYPLPGRAGIWVTDGFINKPSYNIPRFPQNVVAASGTDGAADIYDEVTGIIYSFYQLKLINGKWCARQISTCQLNSMGWPTPHNPTQGSRAIGVPASAGLIRAHEINDGDSIYRHALAMSLTYNALAKTAITPRPGLITAHDNDVSRNTGSIPYGALMMLPPSFDTSKVTNLALRKVADTLKVYGARVVDRNVGTPFVIYVENGAGYDLHHGKWDSKVASDLHAIRGALRYVNGAQGWGV